MNSKKVRYIMEYITRSYEKDYLHQKMDIKSHNTQKLSYRGWKMKGVFQQLYKLGKSISFIVWLFFPRLSSCLTIEIYRIVRHTRLKGLFTLICFGNFSLQKKKNYYKWRCNGHYCSAKYVTVKLRFLCEHLALKWLFDVG